VSGQWLVADGVRIDDRGGVAVEGLSFSSDGPHLVLLGGPAALGRAIAGVVPVTRGSLRVAGVSPREALAAGNVALAELDPALPETWTPKALCTWSARLGGVAQREARARADRAIGKMKLESSAERTMKSLTLAARRATVLASAIATGATTLVIDDPAPGLADDSARALARIAAEALDDVSWVLVTGRLAIASPFGLHADDAVVIGPAGVVAQGAPAEIAARERTYALRVIGSAHALAERAREKGATADAKDRELVVELGPGMTTADLFVIAREVAVTIVSLRPVAGALA